MSGWSEMAFEMDADDTVPLFFVHAGKHSVTKESSVADKAIKSPPSINCLLDHAFGLSPISDVRCVHGSFTAVSEDLVDDLLCWTVTSLTSVSFNTKVIYEYFGALSS
jgi:hypothetical protein